LNGSGRAPSALDAAALRAAGHTVMPTDAAASVTVPGAVDAFCTLAQDYGHKGLAAALAPAIKYAENGVPVAPRVAADWAEAAHNLQRETSTHRQAKRRTKARSFATRNRQKSCDVLRRTVAAHFMKARWRKTW
jgi:gamma-glutamyltranspeptidase